VDREVAEQEDAAVHSAVCGAAVSQNGVDLPLRSSAKRQGPRPKTDRRGAAIGSTEKSVDGTGHPVGIRPAHQVARRRPRECGRRAARGPRPGGGEVKALDETA